MKKLLFTIALLAITSQAFAANWYVRPSGGSGSGTNWTTAWNGLNSINWSSVACGDTVWVAGGTYTTDLAPAKVCTAGNVLTIAAARLDATECTGATGWSSSYAVTNTQIHQTGGAHIYYAANLSYITVSGRTTAAGVPWTYGWLVDLTGETSGYGVEFDRSSSYTMTYTTAEYLDLLGPGHVTYSSDGRGLENTSTHNSGHTVYSHLRIHGWESAAYCVNNSGNMLFEYLDVYDIEAANWSSYHPNGIYTSGSSNNTVRYSKFHKNTYGTGEGIFVEQSGGSNNWTIYGNIFYDLDQSGLKAIEITADGGVSGWKIVNNIFDNILVAPGEYSGLGCSSSEYRNNLFYGTSQGSCGTASNNVTAGSTGAFVNRASHDYHIVSNVGAGYARNAGTNLSSYYTTDMDGVAFGNDGTWDVGAYEYYSGATPTYTVSTSAGTHAYIAPSSAVVSSGSTTTFQITADTGYTAAGTGCSGSLAGTTYTTGSISSNCTVTASASETPRLSGGARGVNGRGIRGH